MRGNILIAYYSRSGNTRKLAQLIHQKVGGTVHEIQPRFPILLHTTQLWNRPKEIQAGFRPPLKTKIEHIEAYDTIF